MFLRTLGDESQENPPKGLSRSALAGLIRTAGNGLEATFFADLHSVVKSALYETRNRRNQRWAGTCAARERAAEKSGGIFLGRRLLQKTADAGEDIVDKGGPAQPLLK